MLHFDRYLKLSRIDLIEYNSNITDVESLGMIIQFNLKKA